MTVSVLLAACLPNEAWFKEQLDSILPQLADADELLVSDDSPPENRRAEQITAQYAAENPRIHYVTGPHQGTATANVEHLLRLAKGEILVLSDQDDVWNPEKLEAIRKAFAENPEALCVLHDAAQTDTCLNVTVPSLFHARGVKLGIIHNLLKNGYQGSCMAVHRALLKTALPFPKGLPMHDQWLGLSAEIEGGSVLLPQVLLYYRRHPGAVTGRKTSLAQKLRWRMGIAAPLLRKLLHLSMKE
ncbi:MAG: glycosyltransferase [Oscillospiraceae bacterium]|jgi:GT2 family glycosyltransferase|nr:glycosyltransferase [Oscillospiraceae bacterium]